MKKVFYIALCLIVSFSLAGCGTSRYEKEINSKYEKEIGEFKLEDYRHLLEQFPREEVIGEIRDIDMLVEETEKIWSRIYDCDLEEHQPYKISYDSENKVYLVEGSFKEPTLGTTFGGVPYMLVEQETGKVLAVWHDK